ncbi:MAG: hypothetical protein CGU28_01405 [Candidatus Dactylopiibacterium carminicum]|uniref:Protein nucleotidyltransferase YdiU n=2 Tax=Candidatus Dactylopiibacterium carminicum TaxID=857335 RepID=A0A272EUL9_9RHOO|nr:SELO family protein [Candidatus Dactylopiibacterium carminicum]PAS93746.1 MAG: hypothetical protein CGU29_06685 [Candidatus Dactylopiibacterium carminicum]PAS98253.1 MAG: hypothetical protein CGU28_01405 [Candidatus Dactylopiibacterium carminicum]PAS99792.1 MAG: hypothetical protein BSR46_06280 [Candidatus Dactylopiibacterium carminicum]
MPAARSPEITLDFDPAFLDALPADPLTTAQPRQVEGATHSFCMPTPVAAPRLLSWSADCAALLGLPAQPDTARAAAAVFSGNALLSGSQPYATCYGGHQFGQWAGQLGDGRALMLGTAIAPDGRRFEVQLKGAGLTPYSRHADGRAVLRSSIREYLCSEAMHHLGIPTTRALCLVASGEDVVRDMFYDGRARAEPGAIVTRVAESFLRIGHLEILAARGDITLLQRLLDHCIVRHFPQLGAPSREVYLAWFGEVCRRTAELIAHWLRVGFVHGVMNTDNLSLLGLTIDYGPYGWLDNFDPHFTPNTTDRGGRYAYGQQARIAGWNLACLANALMPLVDNRQALEDALDGYAAHFETTYLAMLRDKLGLPPTGDAQSDFGLVSTLFDCFGKAETDMTLFYRTLASISPEMPPDLALESLDATFYYPPTATAREAFAHWLTDWQARLRLSAESQGERTTRMNATNPWLIPRNWLAQQAIQAAEAGDLAPLEHLMSAIRDPYTEQIAYSDLAGRRPDWARFQPGCGSLSCSS